MNNVTPLRAGNDDKHEVSTQGLSPLLAHALHTRKARLSVFTREALSEIQSAVLAAINPIADRLGIALDRVVLDCDGSLADLKIEMSVVDALGLDRYARTLLERGHEVDIPPAWFGKRLTFRRPLDKRAPADGTTEVYITGLVEVRPDVWRVRLYDPDARQPMFASPKLTRKLVSESKDA